MTGIIRSVTKRVPKEVPKDPLQKATADTHFMPRAKIPPAQAVIPLPDEEELARARRRRRAGSPGGRAATVLTGGDADTVG